MQTVTDKAALIEQARRRSWFHRIRLDADFETPGRDATPAKLARLDALGLPADLTGKRVLDLGAWDGFFSFEMERRGATVVALDHVEKSATGFGLAAEILGSGVEWRTCNIYHLDPADLGTFDLVLCLGVIYHLRHIILGLDRVRGVMKPGADLFVETAGIDNHLMLAGGKFDTMANACPRVADSPLLQIYAGKELGKDPSNFFAPNGAGLESLLRATEFEVVKTIVGPPGSPSRIICWAKAVSDSATAFYRNRDEAILDRRTSPNLAPVAAVRPGPIAATTPRPAAATTPGTAPATEIWNPMIKSKPPAFTCFQEIVDSAQTATGVKSPADPGAREAVLKAAAVVEGKQKDYQPIYGLDRDGKPSPREGLLRQDYDIVVKEFAPVLRKNQIRILDVGCNAGYASFLLAETFPATIGFDINPDNIRLCQAIKAHTGSSAQFFGHDLMDLVETGRADLENLDCVLLLNVVHQLIFAKGIPYVKSFIAKLAESVDFIVVELATRADYVPHGKDQELPLVPAEIFEDCTESTVTLVREGKRPIYTLRRRHLQIGERRVAFSDRQFGLHPDARVNRKYYYGSDTFTKVIRYTSLQGAAKYTAELRGLQVLEGLDVTPKPLAWDNDRGVGRICMERLYGLSLSATLARLTPKEKPRCLTEIVRIAAALATKALYQHDFASHNFILLSDGSLRLIDLEQSGPVPVRDAFGAFLWLANDIMKGAPEYYRRPMATELVLAKGAIRVDPTVYPAFDREALEETYGKALAEIVTGAATTPLAWQDFIHEAHARLEASDQKAAR